MATQLDSTKLPASWYPLCRSSDLRRGQIASCTVYGIKLTVFRKEGGEAGALISRCCHMGADLTSGAVRGEHLRCPLHHWEFRADGLCARIPACVDKADTIRQPAVECVERYGMIFGWIGAAPKFDLPEPVDLPNPRIGRPQLFEFEANYLTAAINAFDQQHLRSVHHREVIGDPEITSESPDHFRVEFRARVIGDNPYDRMLRGIGKKEVHIRIDSRGGNLLLMRHLETPNNMLLVILPVTESRTRIYAIPIIRRPKSKLIDAMAGAALVELLRTLTMIFVGQDFAALRGMNVTLGKLLGGVDDTVKAWAQYWNNLPRTDHPVWQRHLSLKESD